MSISADKIQVPHDENVTITEDTLSVDLSDGANTIGSSGMVSPASAVYS